MSLASRFKENPKAFYTLIRSKRVARERADTLKDRRGRLCVEPEEVDEILNEHFTSVLTKERDVEVRERCVNALGQVNIMKEDVLVVDRSPGPDGIYPRRPWEAREEIAGALTANFAPSLASGEVPEDWGLAKRCSL
eukprot:g16347.t1